MSLLRMTPHRTEGEQIPKLRFAVIAILAILLAAAVAGCGFGAAPGTKAASIEVTSGFGSRLIGSATEQHVPAMETVMSLLERHFSISIPTTGQQLNGIT